MSRSETCSTLTYSNAKRLVVGKPVSNQDNGNNWKALPVKMKAANADFMYGTSL
jgi:hypothetical protein